MSADLRQGLTVSAVFHIAVLLAFTVKMLVFPTEKIEFAGAVKVDLVALPDILPKKTPQHTSPKARKVKDISTPKKKTKPRKVVLPKKEASKTKSKATLNKQKTESSAKAALQKLKAKMALDKLRKLKEEAPQPGPSKEIKYAGNILAAGTELRGLQKVQMDSFIADIDRHVKKRWILPEWMASRPDLRAAVIIKLDERGFLQAVNLVSSSGDSRYDDLVLETIKKSDPFPAPSKKFRDIVGVKGIKLGFPE